MLTYRARSHARASQAWPLIARPRRWPEWAPHVRDAAGLGDPEVEPGRDGTVRLLGAVPIPVAIIAKSPGRSWTWRAGPLAMTHRADPTPDGCVVSVEVSAARAVEELIRFTYGPLIAILMRRLARVAEDG